MKIQAQNLIQSSALVSSPIQNRHEENLRYIEDHQQIFDIENSYLLNLFKEFIGEKRKYKGGSISCCCNIENDHLYPERFVYLCEVRVSDPTIRLLDIEDFLSFSYHVEERPEIQIDRSLLQQFLATGLDPSKVVMLIFGIDNRPELRHSRIKIYVTVRNYPEKIATAIALCGKQRDWGNLIVNGTLQIGFDFFFNNRAAVEVYPIFYKADLQRPDVQSYLAKRLPAKLLPLLQESEYLQIGISNDNESDVLYFKASNNMMNSLGNERVKQVYSKYRNLVFEDLYIGIPESEFSAESIQSVKMYYQMNDCLRSI
jgi:LynF/TruF/PatF family peptide O-prenyltransferase